MENGNEKFRTGTGPSEAHREMLELIDIIHQMNLTDIYRRFQRNVKEYTCVSAAYETLSLYSETKKSQQIQKV